MNNIVCNDKCCELIVYNYNNSNDNINFIKKHKAGVILYNKNTNSILLIQSRGNLWGFPKGSFEDNETSVDCANRELQEETGIEIDKSLLNENDLFRINNNVTYFFVNVNNNLVTITENNNQKYNDVSGIGWIKLECIQELINNNTLIFNLHAKKCLHHYFNISKTYF